MPWLKAYSQNAGKTEQVKMREREIVKFLAEFLVLEASVSVALSSIL